MFYSNVERLIFTYETGKALVRFRVHQHAESNPVCVITDSVSAEGHHHHAHSLNVRLRLSNNLSIYSRSYEEGDETITNLACPACGSTDPEHSCVVIEGETVYCDSCHSLKKDCICEFACSFCGKIECICYICKYCESYPCICGAADHTNENTGGSSGSGNNKNENEGFSKQDSTIVSNEKVTKENFKRLIFTERLKENVRKYLGFEPDSSIIEFDDNIIRNPATNAVLYNGKIIISNSIIEKQYSLNDLESIVFHEYVHLKQPEADMNDVITKEIPYADFETEDAIMDFCTALNEWHLPIDDSVELTEEQKNKKSQLWDMYMSDYFDSSGRPKSRLVCFNHQYCINEKEAYTLQLQVYGNEISSGEFKEKMIYQKKYYTYLCEQLIK